MCVSACVHTLIMREFTSTNTALSFSRARVETYALSSLTWIHPPDHFVRKEMTFERRSTYIGSVGMLET